MSYLDQALEMAGRLGGGVAELFGPAAAAKDRAQELERSLKDLRAAGESEDARAVRALADGQLAPKDVPRRLSAWTFDSAPSKALVAAIATAHRRVGEHVGKAVPEIFEQLQRQAAATVAESVTLAQSLPRGVSDERSAYAASKGGTPTHFGSWVRLGELVGIWDACHGLAWHMMSAGWLAGPTTAEEAREVGPHSKYAYPKRLPAGYWQLPPELRLARAAAAKALPGLYPWAVAVEGARRDRPRIRSLDQPMQRIEHHPTGALSGAVR